MLKGGHTGTNQHDSRGDVCHLQAGRSRADAGAKFAEGRMVSDQAREQLGEGN